MNNKLLDLDEEFKNIKEDDKKAREIIKEYCKNNGNKLSSEKQFELINNLKDVNKRKYNLNRLLRELNIKFNYSHLKDEYGYKYIFINY